MEEDLIPKYPFGDATSGAVDEGFLHDDEIASWFCDLCPEDPPMTTAEDRPPPVPAAAEGNTGLTAPSVEVGDGKRKAREDNQCQIEDFDAAEAKKQACGSTSTRRSLVHNQSERRRRDRIKEKMKALQELIPRCNRSDKASILDQAIEYIKLLQMQQQMFMGYGMVHSMMMGTGRMMPYPSMLPGSTIQNPVAAGPSEMMGMGPMMPYPYMLPGSTIQNPTAAGPRFPMVVPGFHPHQVRGRSGSQPNPHNPNQPQMMQISANGMETSFTKKS